MNYYKTINTALGEGYISPHVALLLLDKYIIKIQN